MNIFTGMINFIRTLAIRSAESESSKGLAIYPNSANFSEIPAFINLGRNLSTFSRRFRCVCICYHEAIANNEKPMSRKLGRSDTCKCFHVHKEAIPISIIGLLALTSTSISLLAWTVLLIPISSIHLSYAEFITCSWIILLHCVQCSFHHVLLRR